MEPLTQWWGRASGRTRLLVAAGATVLAVALIGAAFGEDPEEEQVSTSRTTSTTAARPTSTTARPTTTTTVLGDPEVYRKIAATSDCGELQDIFDTASDNNDRETPGSRLHKVTLAYMEAANDRMEDLGCY